MTFEPITMAASDNTSRIEAAAGAAEDNNGGGTGTEVPNTTPPQEGAAGDTTDGGPMRVEIGSPDRNSEISDTLPVQEGLPAAGSSERPVIQGFKRPSPASSRAGSPHLRDRTNLEKTIKDLQEMMVKMKEDLTRLQEENAALRSPSSNITITTGKTMGNGLKPLQDIDKKDVEKPGKFKGDPLQWRGWMLKFTAFLARRDPRWAQMIKEIKSRSQKPMEEEEEAQVFKAMNIGGTEEGAQDLKDKFKEQLHEYLENFTDGTVRSMVHAAGIDGVMETFRVMCDEHHSKRDRHLKKEYRTVTNPKQASFENLRQAIATWETEVTEYETASDSKIDARTRLLCLEDMCPDVLQQHIASKENLTTYAEYKSVINDYLVERKRWTTPGRNPKINWLGLQEAQEENDDNDNFDGNNGSNEGGDIDDIMNEVKATLLALVKTKFGGGKGGGKGKFGNAGKGSGNNKEKDKDNGKSGNRAMDVDGPKCYECGEPMAKCNHSAKDCPMRKARVAAGGPERLPFQKGMKGNGKGKGGKGDGWPSKTMWNNFYPGPSQTQWRGWYPQPPQHPNGKINLFEQPHQLSAMTPLQALLQLPGGGLCKINPKCQVKNKATTTFEHKNKFGALAGLNEEAGTNSSTKMEVRLLDAIKGPSLNKQKKANRGPPERQNKGAQESPTITTTQRPRELDGKTLLQNLMDFVNKSKAATPHIGVTGAIGVPSDELLSETPLQSCNLFNPKATRESLKPMSTSKSVSAMGGEFEVFSSIVDSGATVPVMHPEDAEAYELLESEASRNGVEYEVANEETLPNLGEKKFAVLTSEGTLRGYQSQCAEVSKKKPLQAVRALVSSRHAVCFGLGENDDEHLIINKVSGEVNRMRDDGINYLQDMLVVPQDKIPEVQQAIWRMQNNGDDGGGPGFGGQGR